MLLQSEVISDTNVQIKTLVLLSNELQSQELVNSLRRWWFYTFKDIPVSHEPRPFNFATRIVFQFVTRLHTD